MPSPTGSRRGILRGFWRNEPALTGIEEAAEMAASSFHPVKRRMSSTHFSRMPAEPRYQACVTWLTVAVLMLRHSPIPTMGMVLRPKKELDMMQTRRTERPAIVELSVEEMEKISGGRPPQTVAEWAMGEAILIKITLATGGLRPATQLN